ncbi:Protein kinase [Penicillium bovifimosum]|uniref:Protein kinase n=1 Tax=Penicillium bovifimosum TaxID=126998 RepID=A0A9W9HB69_9EURO|nr:Protein kinase [Penicillium bovifimosum]KAJ5143125.1 Protein kinase [Penicillium bovifimosum]
MVATISPHRDSGGTLHLSSHSGIHHVDASSAIRQLRRSLSRSPSKSSNFFFNPRTQSPSKSTYISSPLSPSRRASQNNFVLFPHQSPLAVPYPPSAKISRPAMRRRTSPRSPAKRVLSVSTDGGNATPTQPVSFPPGEENDLTLDDLVPSGQSTTPDSPCFINTSAPLTESTFSPRPTLSRIEKRRSGTFGTIATGSPLKRSDGIMNLDQASRGSPAAKRRSVHMPNMSTEFSIFDNEVENTTPEGSPSANVIPSFPTPVQPYSPFATIPKRSSSLRRSTLQQRGERPLFGRPKAMEDSAEASPPGTPLSVRPRKSFDSSLFQPGSENIFSPRPPASPLFSSNTPADLPANPTIYTTQPPRPAAHPLSRTITQSSSGSSLDDSPTHEPVHKPEVRRPMFNFSKSLPAGATRPAPVRKITQENSSETFATPDNYKLVKPLPAAFMSTGLISKKNRNAEENLGFSKNMPDTPCKRPVNIFTAGPNPADRLFDKSRLSQQSDAGFASPFNAPPTSSRPKPSPFARGMGIFGGSFNRPEASRRGSFASIDGDELILAQSPSSRHDSQPLNDDFPPTPTKQPFLPSRTFPPSTSHLSMERLSETASPLHDKFLQASPHTPRDKYFPPDPSGLSISVPNDRHSVQEHELPATPTGPRDSWASFRRPSLQISGYHAPDVDPTLTSRFDNVELIGTGEFSEVYRVANPHDASFPSVFSLPSSEPKSPSSLPHQVWAIKKSKQPYMGLKDRERRIREVDILKALTNCDHVVSFMDSWESNGHLYIQTEFCEEGSLDGFLTQAGLKARLDDFRIWKILLEMSLGLKQIHDEGFIHLDLKPANILVTFDGTLKIGDFGMATRWPAEDGIEGEGDREYIGPEILMGQFDKPADIFSLGLIIFEIAGNVELPDNGASWQKLRNGDMSDVPSLTWSSESSIFRDASGNPISEETSFEELCTSDLGGNVLNGDFLTSRQVNNPKPQRLARSGELIDPPDFMVNANHPHALDGIVRWMISPEPQNRPTADQVLETYGVQFINQRRRAGATVFEGNWGPADEILAEDAEMIDV